MIRKQRDQEERGSGKEETPLLSHRLYMYMHVTRRDRKHKVQPQHPKTVVVDTQHDRTSPSSRERAYRRRT